jgi:hypothetical protein
MKLTPEEEKSFDEWYQVLIDAHGQAEEFLLTHKQQIKEITEKVKGHMAGGAAHSTSATTERFA